MKKIALVAALGAIAATAWAMNDSYYPGTTTTLAPAQPVVVHETVVTDEPAPVVSEPAPATRGVVIAEDRVTQPPITVEQRRLSLDERIQSDVMDAVLRTPNITGKIGVESSNAIVTLTGWTNTSGQAFRAGRSAQGVQGVKYVDNQIRPRVGGSI